MFRVSRSIPRDGNSRGNAHHRPRALVLWLTGIIMLAVVGAQTFVLTDAGRSDREGAKDNLLWTLSQVIVEVQYAETQVLEAFSEGQPISAQRQAKIKSASDIALSRTQVAISAFRSFYGPDTPAPGLMSIQSSLTETIGILEAKPMLDPRALAELQSRFKDLVRVSYAEVTGYLHGLLSYEQQQREERVRLLGYAMLGVWFLAGLLLLAVFQGIRANRLFVDEARKTELAALRLQRAFDASPYSVCMLDYELNVISHNNRCDRFAPFDSGEGDQVQNLLQYLGPDDRAMVTAAVHKDLEEGQRTASPALSFQTDITGHSGASIPVEVILARLTGSGRDAEFVAFIRDRSADVAAERDLRSARDRAVADAGIKERFLTLIGHELRTPLQGVLAAVELLDPQDGVDRGEFLRISARQCAQSALAQIDNVLLHARSGRLNEAEEPFSPKEIVESIVQEFAALAAENENDLVLQVEAAEPGIQILGPATSFNLAVRNLLGNAIKYTKKGTVTARLVLTVAGPDVDVAFSVADTGAGIAEDQMPTLFDEYMRVGGAGEHKPSGFGLGLPIAKASVERLGGRIHVQSTVGKGSVFDFSFRAPAQTPSAAAVPDVAPETTGMSAAQSKRVLLVEDNPVNQTLLLAMLHRLGHAGVAASTGEQALELAKERVFDHIFMDLGLPGIDGIATARELRQSGLNTSCPITILTARDPGEVVFQAGQVGIREIIRKPVDMERLRLALDGQTDRRDVESGRPILSPDFGRTIDLVGRPVMQELVVAALNESSGAIVALREWQVGGAPTDGIIQIVHKAVGSAGMIGALLLSEGWQDVETTLRLQGTVSAGTVERMQAVLLATRREVEAALIDKAPCP